METMDTTIKIIARFDFQNEMPYCGIRASDQRAAWIRMRLWGGGGGGGISASEIFYHFNKIYSTFDRVGGLPVVLY